MAYVGDRTSEQDVDLHLAPQIWALAKRLGFFKRPADLATGRSVRGPILPGGGNNAGRDAVNPFPRAYPAAGVLPAETFLRQFFSAALALPKTEHCGRISSQRLAKAQALCACGARVAAHRVARYDVLNVAGKPTWRTRRRGR
jgi:hypothetical protein